jgi:putative transposase
MTNNTDKRRHSIRLPGYDYSATGAYFVTICTHRRECRFGRISAAGNVTLNHYGLITFDEWRYSAAMREEIDLDAFVVMPNHVHGIVVIRYDICGNNVGATGQSPLQEPEYPPRGPAGRSLASFIVGYKGAVTRRINALRKSPGAPVWQRNYYERILRNEEELNRARFYIRENPARWADDDYYPAAREGKIKDNADSRVFR